jgi:ubiquitin carboxyl-terminal hydrolase 5/13
LQNGDLERAVEWVFSHPDDTGEEEETGGEAPNRKAAFPGSPALPARYRLRAFISHKGTSVHSGHYVAHIRIRTEKDADGASSWVLFNDEKVVRADAESIRALKPLAYLYVFEKERT